MKPNNFRIIGETVTIFYKKYKIYLDKSTFLKYYKDYRFNVKLCKNNPVVVIYKKKRIRFLQLIVDNKNINQVRYKDGNKLNLCSSNLSTNVNTYKLIYNSNTNEVYVKMYFDNCNLFGIIDFKTYCKVKHLKFCFDSYQYVCTTLNKKRVGLHQIVFGKVTKGKEIDHINRNKIDNRLSNLREVTRLENCMNSYRMCDSKGSSKYKGVSYNKKLKKKWVARLQINGCVFREKFYTEIEAAREYDRYVKKYCGDVGYLNFP